MIPPERAQPKRENTMITPDMKPMQTRALPVPLTAEELHLKSQEMATAERVLAEAEAEEAAQATAWAARKKSLEKSTADARAKLAVIGRVVREKREFRAIEIVESPNNDAKTVDTVRVDTGEVIETRGMNQSELQRSLFALNAKKLDDEDGTSAQA